MVTVISRLYLIGILLVNITLFWATAVTTAEEEWILQRTVPYDIDVFRDVAFLDDGQTGWLVGFIQYSRIHTGSALLKTCNGGETWTEHETGINTIIEAICFPEERTGWIVGNRGTIAKSTDAGNTWTPQESGTEFRLRDVYFLDINRGWAVGDNSILFTSNGGSLWQGAGTRYTTQFNAITFPTEQHGWIVGNGGIIYQTVDGGSTWTVSASPSSQDLTGIFFHDEQTGWIVGKNGTVLSTVNAGTTWIPLTSGTAYGLHDLSFTDENLGWAVGSMGTMLSTDDGGLSWTPVNVPTSTTLYAVHMTSSGTGWICGAGGVCLETQDSGASWHYELDGPNAHLMDVFFADAKYGWACGWNGTVLHTTDGGQQWNARRCGLDALLIGVDFIDRQKGFMVTFEGDILRTVDGGSSWSTIQAPAGTFRSMDLIDPDHIWIAGEHSSLGAIFQVQADGSGYDIVVQVSIGGPLHDIQFANASCGWAVGTRGTILHTSDSGENWNVQDSGIEAELSHIYANNCSSAWVTGNFSGLLRTTNGGQEWRYIDLPPDYTYGPLSFPTPQDGWVVGRSTGNGAVLIVTTTDGGNTWNTVPMPLEDGFFAMDFVSGQEGWTVGEKGNIWYYTNLPLYSISGQVLYCENSKPIQGVTVSLSGSTTDTVETDEEGAFRFSDLRQGRNFCLESHKNDALQHVITSFDASLILSSLLGRYSFDACDSLAADVTGNTNITSFDASNILRYVVGHDVEDLTGSWTFLPQMYCITNLQSDRSDVNMSGVLYGDVSQNWPGLREPGSPEIIAQLPPTGAAAGTEFTSLLFASPITFSCLDSLGILSYQAQIEYDPSLLRVIAVTDTGLITETWGSNLFFSIDHVNGCLRFAKAGTFPLPWCGPSSASLAGIHFQVNPQAASGSTSPLMITSMIFNEGTPWAETRNGSFEVLKHTISGTVSYCSTNVAVPEVFLSLSGDTSYTISTNVEGWYSFNSLNYGEDYCITSLSKTIVPNRVVTSYDAALILRYLAGSYTPGQCAMLASDVNRDGTIDEDDAHRISLFAVGDRPAGRTGIWSFDPPNLCYDPLPADQRNQNYRAFIYGDVSSNYPGHIEPSESPWILVRIPDESVDPGATIGLNIIIDTLSTTSFDSLNIYACDFQLRYDPSILTALLVSTEGLVSELWGSIESTIDTETGIIKIGMASAAPFEHRTITDLPFAKVDFFVHREAPLGTVSPINIQEAIFNEGSPKAYMTGGSISITGKKITGTVRYCDSQQLVEGVTLQIFSLTTEETTTDVHGEFAFSNLPIGQQYCVLPLHGYELESHQRVISSLDAALIFRHVVNSIPFSSCDSTAADVSGDGNITAFDASTILRYVASFEIDSTFLPVSQIGTWSFEPEHHCFEHLVHNESADYTAIVYGDVSQNWPGLSQPKTTHRPELSIDQAKRTPRARNRHLLPLRVNTPSGIIAADIELSYDPNELSAVGASTTPSTKEWKIIYQTDRYGKMKIAMAGPREPTQPGTFVEIEFEADQSVNQDTPCFVDVSVLFNEGQIPAPPTIRHSFKPWPSVPSAFALSQNYPNPFNPKTDIRYQITDERSQVHVTLKIFNTLGQEVRVLIDEPQGPGYYTMTWDGTDTSDRPVASGIYFYRLSIRDDLSQNDSYGPSSVFSETKRMVLLK
jgi:photosystem II stability/assembly factor-like uncharacterized protein